jgi:guanylate kinase
MIERIIIVSAPSGAGKSTLCDLALKDFPDLIDVITYTTRAPRGSESEGHPYHFVSRQQFFDLKETNFFAETAEVHGNMYGTPLDQMRAAWTKSQWVIMDIDVQGARTLKAKFPLAKTIFILPPSIDILRQRIVTRDQGKTNNLEERLANAEKELAAAPEYEHRVVNESIPEAYAQFKKIVEEILKSR